MRTSALLLCLLAVSSARQVYVGSLGSGIWIFSQNGDGTLNQLSNPVQSSSGFLALHPNGKNLFATGAGDKYISYGIDGSNLIQYNDLPGHDGQECWTTHVSVHPDGKTLFGANYKDGSFVAFSLWDNGALNKRIFLEIPGQGSRGDKTNQHRQDGPHAHMIVASPNPNFIIGMDLGADKIWVWRYNSTGIRANSPKSFDVALGSGPRHIAFSPNGNYAYVVDEIACTVLVLKFNKDAGTFSQVQVISSLPKQQQGDGSISAGEIRVHPSGNFVYVTNRNGPSDSIGIFSINATDGTVTPVSWEPSRARSPRGLNLCPSGKYLYVANENADWSGNSLFAFAIDQFSGKLSLIGSYSTGGSCSDVEFSVEKDDNKPTNPPTKQPTSAPSTTKGNDNTATAISYLIENGDRWGGDLPNMPVRASSSQDCQFQCFYNNDCKAWAFDSCGSDCWLKNSVSDRFDSDCRTTGTILGSRTGMGLYGPIEDGDRAGSDLFYPPGTAADAQHCQLNCYQNKDCDSWTFDTCGHECWMKRGSPTKVARTCRATGTIRRQNRILSQ